MNLKVQVWIHARDPQQGSRKFLLLMTRPERGSFWQPVTGSVEPEEAGRPLEEAALREAREESGIAFGTRPEPLGVTFQYEKYGKKFEEHAFSLEAPSNGASLPRLRLDPHEHVDGRWVDADEALRLTHYPSNQDALRALLMKLGGAGG